MTTQADKIIKLIISYLNNELDEAGLAELHAWMNESESNRQAVEEFLTDEQLRKGMANLYATKERIWKRLDEQIPDVRADQPRGGIGRPRRVAGENRSAVVLQLRRFAAAAAILVLLSGAGYFFIVARKGRGAAAPPRVAYTAPIKHDVTPGGNKAVLTLASGASIALDSAGTGSLARLGGTSVVKVGSGEIAYHGNSGSAYRGSGVSGAPGTPGIPGTPGLPGVSGAPGASEVPGSETAYNTLQTPRRGQYRLVLPDGTRVWLNAASSIRFPTAFKGGERRVKVTGEVYFEVAKNVAQPFVVDVDNRVQVEVLGTSFNVNAYTDESSVSTTLVQGLVRVINGPKTALLKPAQQSRMYADGRSEISNDVNLDPVVAWKNGEFQFESDDIRSVMRQLSRWYDVDVTYAGPVPEGTFSGEVSRNSNLSSVLKILELSGLHCKIENNKLTILP